MQDPPAAPAILAAVIAFLRDTAAPELTGHARFEARVAANALEIVRRELLAAGADGDRQRLAALVGECGDPEALNLALAERIRSGEMDITTPGLVDHLWRTTLEKLAVDQPHFAGLRPKGATS